MDSQAVPAAKQKGIKKLWFRIKASMKAEQSKKEKEGTSSTMSTTSKTPAAASSLPTTAQSVEPAAIQTSETRFVETSPSTTQPQHKEAVEESRPMSQSSIVAGIIQVDDEDEEVVENFQMPHVRTTSSDKEATALRFQRAQEVFRKYNLELSPVEWQQTDMTSVPRVEKKPRMRVRYTCHECNQPYGREKLCAACSHVRCETCVRYPAKKTGDKARLPKTMKADVSALATPTTGACHECKTSFSLGASECENCNHQICSRCLQETVMASPATAPPSTQPATVAVASQ